MIFAPSHPEVSAPSNTSSSPSPAQVTEKSIAVLPFENLSEDKQNAFFADGVQDEILTNLAKVADLKVISRTSVMQDKTAASRNLREIGQSLGLPMFWKAVCKEPETKSGERAIDRRTERRSSLGANLRPRSG